MDKFDTEQIKGKLAPLFDEEGLRLVLLFGSVAIGRESRRSDIDLGFLFDRPIDIYELTTRVIRLLRTDKVDVIDLRLASPLLRYSAVRTGKVLFEQTPGLFNTFQSLTFRIYVDSQKMRDAQKNSIRNYLGERGLI